MNGKMFQELKVGQHFFMFTFLVDSFRGSTEEFIKAVHQHDNAICVKNHRTTFIPANDMVILEY